MGLLSKFTNMLKPKSDAFEKGVADTLAQNGIGGEIRPVGGAFDLSTEAAAQFKKIGIPVEFSKAMVVLSDRPNDRAAAFLVGQQPDGSFAAVSLQNIGRPFDLASETDKFSARRAANMFRNTLDATATLVKPQNKIGSLRAPGL